MINNYDPSKAPADAPTDEEIIEAFWRSVREQKGVLEMLQEYDEEEY
ncbi:hypothetical protein [Actinopolyspora erythraea]|nr:hypothetical protein [Actinopolyspora erythraea]